MCAGLTVIAIKYANNTKSCGGTLPMHFSLSLFLEAGVP
jgi:hypothetical protein